MTSGSNRRTGRPPDLAKRRAILDAAREILAESGYGSMTMDEVAQRAGSNRVFIFRVWDTKLALATDALFGSQGPVAVPDTGSLFEDMETFVRVQVERMSEPANVRGLPGITDELLTNLEAAQDVHRKYIKPVVDGIHEILDRARARGEVVDGAPAVLTSIIYALAMTLTQDLRMSPDRITEVVLQTFFGGVLRTGDVPSGSGERP